MQLRQEYLQQVYFLVQQELRFYQVRMLRKYILTVQQQFFVLKCVMKTATTIQENAGDIYAEAKAINEEEKQQKKL